MGICPCKGEGKKARWLAKMSGSLDNWGAAMADKLIEEPEAIDGPTNNDHDETAVGLNIEKKVRFESKSETSILVIRELEYCPSVMAAVVSAC